MANFFFLSLNNCISSIEHTKISVKFDNSGKGGARISFRLILVPSETKDGLEFYLLIKNDENPFTYQGEDSEYNIHLDTEQFRQVAGAYGLKSPTDFPHCTIFTIDRFPERVKIQKRSTIKPKKIICELVEFRNIPKELENLLSTRDILLRIKIDDVGTIMKEVSNILQNQILWMLQFRIYLEHVISSETLKCWESSSKSWSVDLDIHKKLGYENVVKELEQKKILRYPKSLELWFTIPNSHLFVASSPIYERAFRLKSEDIAYKTKNQQNVEFTTQEGDYAVKIVNKKREFVEFSITCFSPFLPGEKPEELKKEIADFHAEKISFVTWPKMINPLILLLALLALVYAIVSLFITAMAGDTELRPNLWTISAAAIFFGLSVWGISTLFHFIFSKMYLEKRKYSFDLMARSSLSIAIIIVVAILAFSVFFLLGKVYFAQ